jgi:DNA polymerase-3 subunit delta'
MNREAANCFLKTLEEPPAQSTLILITSSPHLLLPTLLSRCQRITFSPFPTESVREILRTQRGLTSQEAWDVAAYSLGRIGRALTLQPDHLREEKLETLKFITSLAHEGISSTFKRAEIWGRDNETMEDKLLWLSLWIRDLLLIKIGLPPETVTEVEILPQLQGIARSLSLDQIYLLHEKILTTRQGLFRNHNRQLSMEQLLLSLREHLMGHETHVTHVDEARK